MLVRIWSNRNYHSLFLGMQNGAATLEDSSVVSYKTKYTFSIQSKSLAPWHLSKEAENLAPHKNLHMDVCSSYIHNCQDLEAAKMSFSR